MQQPNWPTRTFTFGLLLLHARCACKLLCYGRHKPRARYQTMYLNLELNAVPPTFATPGWSACSTTAQHTKPTMHHNSSKSCFAAVLSMTQPTLNMHVVPRLPACSCILRRSFLPPHSKFSHPPPHSLLLQHAVATVHCISRVPCNFNI